MNENNYKFAKGNISYSLDQPGLYSIGLMVNGGCYEKKFKVE